MSRTFVVGDVHGERELLEQLLAKLPWIAPEDTIVFLGDYLDRGPDSRGVVERLRRLPEETAGKVVCLRGNHEDAWIESLDEPKVGFLLPQGNGCASTYRSYLGIDRELELTADQMSALFEPRTWMPAPHAAWMRQLPTWYEDDHAIYVHAGLEGEGAAWRHPRDSATAALLWMREPDFWAQYEGKALVFGHTPTADLPPADETRRTIWRRGPLVGLDTGAGRGGPLTAIALPDGEVFTSSSDTSR
ncbi:MAG TPA: metallophosphoesterase family protein [Kofleriaceae bacterium]|nr:metallophosphoesterase family protein [Kofleriaceae bacterium]